MIEATDHTHPFPVDAFLVGWYEQTIRMAIELLAEFEGPELVKRYLEEAISEGRDVAVKTYKGER
jgi:hypothetical protein